MPGLVGFLVNPIAGIGGRLGFKGSDGAYGITALLRGAEPVAPGRARAFLEALRARPRFLAPRGVMGWRLVVETGHEGEPLACVSERIWPTTAADTRRCAKAMAEAGVDLIVFVGGDGTARDVYTATGGRVPLLGVPSGVKVYSSVFAEDPVAAARVLEDLLRGHASLGEGEIVDVDEDYFRRGELRLRLYGVARTPVHPDMVGASKQPSPRDEEDAVGEIADYIVEEVMERCTLYILGPGGTVAAVARRLGVEKTLLGVDAVHNGKLVGRDLDEEGILSLLDRYRRAAIILSPIGGQGYILGRGNQQISPRVVRRVGLENIIIVASPSKLSRIPRLRVDTGDPRLDEELRGRHVKVLTGWARYRVARIG